MPITTDIIFSERIWDFDTDELRLSSMTNSRFLDYLQDTFNFAKAEIARPRFSDGRSVNAWPPGIVCELGIGPVNLDLAQETSDEIAFKTLKISPGRIGIEVAGTSDHADEVFRFFRSLLAESRTPEGHPFIGEHRRVWDLSFIAVRGTVDPWATIIPNPLQQAFRQAFGANQNDFVYGELVMNVATPDSRVMSSDQAKWSIRPRFDTRAGECVLESRAFLHSNEHRSLLQSVFEP
jgi:hypothetical protein